jgi:hypothetical protein
LFFFNWYQVLNLFPRSSIAFESRLVLSIFLLLLNWWRSILAICVKLSFDSLFHLDDCIVNKGEKVLAQRWFLQEGKDFGVVATFIVINTLLLFERALLFNPFLCAFCVVNTLIKGEIEKPSPLV